MLGIALLVFREVLEAALIVTVVAAATRGVPRRSLFVGGGMFLVLYVLPVWLLDPRIREASSQWLATMQAGREGP